ncbi:hypothetical protein L1049_021878 [Liquidambar formosana]|uniref:Uncharacterized protein n=1 Tax=Liquidambar formosana TaxID=63359 RepID=A0AAP0WN50_LIQFO
MNTDVGKLIGNKVGEFVDMEQREEGLCWGKFLRIRVRVNVLQPLKHGVTLKVKDQTMHSEKDCDMRYTEGVLHPDKVTQYEAWLRVLDKPKTSKDWKDSTTPSS